MDNRDYYCIISTMATIDKFVERIEKYPFDAPTLQEVAVSLHVHGTIAGRQVRKQVLDLSTELYPGAKRHAVKIRHLEQKFQTDIEWATAAAEGEDYLLAIAKDPTLPWQLTQLLQSINRETPASLFTKNILTNDIQKLRDLLGTILASHAMRQSVFPIMERDARGDVQRFACDVQALIVAPRDQLNISFSKVPPTFGMMK